MLLLLQCRSCEQGTNETSMPQDNLIKNNVFVISLEQTLLLIVQDTHCTALNPTSLLPFHLFLYQCPFCLSVSDCMKPLLRGSRYLSVRVICPTMVGYSLLQKPLVFSRYSLIRALFSTISVQAIIIACTNCNTVILNSRQRNCKIKKQNLK